MTTIRFGVSWIVVDQNVWNDGILVVKVVGVFTKKFPGYVPVEDVSCLNSRRKPSFSKNMVDEMFELIVAALKVTAIEHGTGN